LDEIIHNWDILANIVNNHKDFFIDLYKSYFNDKKIEVDLKDEISQFILKHTIEFN